jgi:hypothetical protein
LDDIWKPALVDGFRSLTPGCQLLITTRDQSVLDRAQARSHPVGLLDLPASRALFTEVLGSANLPQEADSIFAACGGLPLAIAAAASIVRLRGWTHTQNAFVCARLDALKTRWLPDSEQENLAVVLAASVEALLDRERACFLTCATWPEDVPMPTSALDLYWSAYAPDAFDQEEIANALADASCSTLQIGHLRVSLGIWCRPVGHCKPKHCCSIIAGWHQSWRPTAFRRSSPIHSS